MKPLFGGEPEWPFPLDRTLVDYTIPGFLHHGAALFNLVRDHRPERMVEVGTYFGKSAVPLARLLRGWYGSLVCIDLWAGVDGLERMDATAAHLERNGLTNVTLVRGASVNVAARFPAGSVDALYLDGSHQEQDVVDDLHAWARVVRPGGLIMGDDYGGQPGQRVTAGDPAEVTRAWTRFAKSAKLTLHTENGPNVPGLVWVTLPATKGRP